VGSLALNRTVAAAAAVGVLLAAVDVHAQGNGRGNAFGHYKSAVSASAPAVDASGAPIPGTGVRNFGSWLDDASVLEVGSGYVSMGFGLFRTPVYREVNLPTIDSGVALHRRVQLAMSVPYYRGTVDGTPVGRGFGDVYLSAKVQLREPSSDRVGFGIIPMIEVLSVPPPDGSSRMQWALPASVEVQRDGWRFYGTGGYFSRGAMFGSGALEIAVTDRTALSGVVSQTYSLKHDDLSAALGLRKARTDVSGGFAFAMRPDVALYASVGRTISARDSNSATLMFNTGVSLGFK
jgi:hypothetical protein